LFGSSPQQKAVENATSELLLGPDWAANVEIYESVNRAEDGGRDTLKAIAKRMTHKNPHVALLALELLGACVNNCRAPFHMHVHKMEFLEQLAKVGTHGPSGDVKDKALTLIITWAEAFRSHPDFPNFDRIYQQLKAKGFEFPARDMNAMAPVFTPASHGRPPLEKQRSGASAGSTAPAPAPAPAREEEEESVYSWVSPEYIAKIKTELKEVLNYVDIVKEILAACEGPVPAQQNETLKGLVATLQEMQSRLTRVLVEVEHETLVDWCLQVNDHIRVVLEWHSAILANQSFSPPQLPAPQFDGPVSPSEHKVPDSVTLGGPEQKQAGPKIASILHVGEEDEEPPSDSFESLALRRKNADQSDEKVVDEFEQLAMRDSQPAPAAAAPVTDQSIREFEDLLGLTDKPPASSNPSS